MKCASSPSCTCAEGTCSYATREQPCASGSCNAGVCGTSRCEGMYCDKPPARHCKDDSTLLVFSPRGPCSSADGVAECLYSTREIPCESKCENGYCVEDPCLGVTCTVPPASYCSGSELVVFEPGGRCDKGACVYDSHREACANGCDAGQCVDQPCVGVTCASPPASYCVDGVTLRSFGSGTCEQGTCVYAPTDETCEAGCNAGQCAGDPCNGVLCNTPPPSACTGDGALRAWDGQPGQCVDGGCEYATFDQACGGGCDAGQCVGDACAGVTCASPPADYCADDATLVRYGDATDTCDNGACIYGSETVSCPSSCKAGQCVEGSESCEADTCNDHGTCSDTGGEVSCSCDDGWTGDRCEDNVDECATGEHDCDAHATCTDTDGAWECTCNAGYEGNGTSCSEIDGCAGDPCFGGVSCTDVPAPGTGYTCGACPTGYEGDGETCTDIDGCAGDPCAAGVACTDVPAPGSGYTCGACPTGYEGDGVTCTDIDDCAPNPCENGGTCTDLVANFSCSCTFGWGGDTCADCEVTNGGLEQCDGFDNDCNGQTDESLTIACGGADPNGCGVGYDEPCPNGANEGLCEEGTRGCDSASASPGNPVWLPTCENATSPATDVCDLQDNDCDGVADEDYDLQYDVSNCGGCGNDCTTMGSLWPDFGSTLPAHAASVACDTGSCVVTSCDPGWDDDPGNSFADCLVDSSVPVGCSGAINFPDANLEARVRTVIDKPTGDIYYADLSGLTSFSAQSSGIANISGMQCFTGLTFLDLAWNQYSDLSSLSGLTNLQDLRINDNQITSVAPLSGLANLTQLGLNANQISDISPLSSLTSMTKLSLFDNQIADINALANMTGLTELFLYNNQIVDIGPLAGMTSLTQLYLYNNQIANISALCNLTSLTYLRVESNQILDVTPLANLTNITHLVLDDNQITDISSLDGLTKIWFFEAASNQITDVDALQYLPNLSFVYINDNQITNLAPLVSNAGVGSGDTVRAQDNSLNCTDAQVQADLTELESRGVNLTHDCW